MNFYKHFLGDYARDTAHLSMLEHGAYRLMLDHYYATGKSLPADKALLYRICKASAKTERAAVDLVADAFFPVNGDGSRHNYRADKELGDAAAYAEAQSERANKRWKKQADVPVHMPPHIQAQSPADASHSQIPEKQKSKASSASADLPGFVRFWNAWPRSERKQGKPKCLAIWKRKGLEAKADQVIAHVEKMAQSESWQSGFDPMPETYLNGDRWDGADLGAPAGAAKPWTETWSGIVEKGKSLGIEKHDNESNPEFKQRVLEAAKVAA